jgi:hypothetical protein
MGRNGVSPEKAARRKEILASIGRELRKKYQATQPLSDRLSELVRKIEHCANESATAPDRSEP